MEFILTQTHMDQELYSAIKSGNTAAFQEAIEKDEKATLEARTKKDDTVLHVACKMDRVALVELILGLRREMVNAKNVYGETPMHVTCIRGHLRVMKMLMASNQWMAADVDNHGRTPLYLACHYGRLLLVEHLLQFRWMPASDQDGGLCLRIATSRGHAVSNRRFQIAEYLINNTRVDVDARNIKGKTAADIVAADQHGSRSSRSTTLHKLLLEKQTIHGPKTGDEYFQARDFDCLPPPLPSLDQQLENEEETHQDFDNFDVEEYKLKSMNRRKSLRKLYKKQKQEKTHKKMYGEGLQNARNTVIIVAVLIATVAFTAGVSPPGGVYQDGPQIGKSVLARTTTFKVFMVSNTVALFASLGIVIVLVSVIPFKRKPLVRMLKYSHKVMWVAVLSMATSFLAASWATVPRDKGRIGWVKVVLPVVAGGCLGGVFLGWSVMLGRHLKMKSKWRRKRILDLEQEKETDSEKNEVNEGVRALKRRLREDFDGDSSFSDVASSSNLGYHPV